MANETETTTQTYDHIAAEFADRVWDTRVEGALENFCRYVRPQARVLDLGCGPGRDTMLLRQCGYQVVGIDRSLGMLREAQWRVGGTLLCGDMRHLPLAAASLDGVWLCAALLHLPKADARPALAEIRRVLRHQSPLYVSVKQGEGENWTTYRGMRFFAYYQPDELSAMMNDAGYTVQQTWLNPQEQVTWVNLIATK
jgi:ubiquinone/menaquinone biosynthesis C-methylase UbiE